jgi:hypothetical protein
MGTIATRPSAPASSTGKTVQGPGGGTWGAVQTPGGGMIIGHQRPGGGGSIGVVGAGGGTGGIVKGPNGGTAGRVTGPGGGSAAAIQGPNGGSAAVIRGPAGGAIGAARGPNGGEMAGFRTRYGGAGAVARLPDGSTRVAWRGGDYWYSNGGWYQPYWHDDDIWYYPCYAPIGYYTTTLDCGSATASAVNINGTTYYQCNNVYYTQTTQNGQSGYTVVENPVQPAAPAEPNSVDPFVCLKEGLDFLGHQVQFDMSVNDIYDEVTAQGQKVSYTTRRNIFVRRPDRVTIEYRGDGQDHRTVIGKGTFTFLNRTANTYSQIPVPANIDGALDVLADKYNTVVVVGELLHTGLYDRVAENIVSGQYLGADRSTGYACDHLAFTSQDADYEFWVDSGATPLIRKLSIVYRNAPGRPRYTMAITRFSAATVPDAAFEVRIPSSATLVPITGGNAASTDTSSQQQQQPQTLAPSAPNEMSVP